MFHFPNVSGLFFNLYLHFIDLPLSYSTSLCSFSFVFPQTIWI